MLLTNQEADDPVMLERAGAVLVTLGFDEPEPRVRVAKFSVAQTPESVQLVLKSDKLNTLGFACPPCSGSARASPD